MLEIYRFSVVFMSGDYLNQKYCFGNLEIMYKHTKHIVYTPKQIRVYILKTFLSKITILKSFLRTTF